LAINEDFLVTLQGRPIPQCTAKISKSDSRVLELGILAAWDELPGVHNLVQDDQVEVRMYCSFVRLPKDGEDSGFHVETADLSRYE
jgi:hypothetical protein